MRQNGSSAVELMITMLIISLMLSVIGSIYLQNEQNLQNVNDEYYVSVQIQNAASSLMAGDKLFIKSWQEDIAVHLPQGHGEVKRALGLYVLTIAWFDRFEKVERSRLYTVLAS